MLHYRCPARDQCHHEHRCTPPRVWTGAVEVVVVVVAIPTEAATCVRCCRTGPGARRDRRTIQALAGR